MSVGVAKAAVGAEVAVPAKEIVTVADGPAVKSVVGIVVKTSGDGVLV